LKYPLSEFRVHGNGPVDYHDDAIRSDRNAWIRRLKSRGADSLEGPVQLRSIRLLGLVGPKFVSGLFGENGFHRRVKTHFPDSIRQIRVFQGEVLCLLRYVR